MEQRQRPAERAFKQVLSAADPRAVLDAELVVEFVLSESKHGDEVSPGTESHLDEPIPPLEHQPQRPRSRIKTLPRASNDDGDSPPHPLTIHASPAEYILATLPGHARQPHSEDVLPIKRDAEVTIQRKEGIRDPREQLRESQRLSRECRECAVGDDAVGVVPEDVLPRRAQLNRSMQSCGKIPRE
ncbi:hypothetical protein V490_05917 [Pseudogymnoascus sp. VKM F-3557]|nr:hypothetical protein V490_05917 [Pseudogymnoascus sp. VKM F-3557]